MWLVMLLIFYVMICCCLLDIVLLLLWLMEVLSLFRNVDGNLLLRGYGNENGDMCWMVLFVIEMKKF